MAATAKAERDRLRRAFTLLERQPDIYFYTSSIDKFLQARLVFQRAGVRLRHFRRTTEYAEEYGAGTEGLLRSAVREVTASIGRSSLLFIEDTSVRIEGLSTEGRDIPGLRVKEWFKETTFQALDHTLRQQDDVARRAEVRSDIALHVPQLERPVFFHGATRGSIALTPPTFQASRQYPWLTPDSFNGWFVPDGVDRPLGQLSLEESWTLDFRVRSLTALLDRLEEYTSVLNLPSQAYSRRQSRRTAAELTLFPAKEPRVFVVVGPTCAGKTTFGDYAGERFGATVIEASSVVRMLRDHHEAQEGAPLRGDTPADAAHALLELEGRDTVAKHILRMPNFGGDEGTVITGFRTIEEVAAVKGVVPHVEVVVIGASERVRFERLISRKRMSDVRTMRDFRALDEAQARFGLLRVINDLADLRLTNEGSLEEYLGTIGRLLAGEPRGKIPGIAEGVHPSRTRTRNQLFRALAVLASSERALSCDEIEAITTADGHAIRHNNANKVLRAAPELATRVEELGDRVRYELSPSGRVYLALVAQVAENPLVPSTRGKRRSERSRDVEG